jgi:hypothetical protein
MMTPAECLAKRNELNAQARAAKAARRPDIAARCRHMATELHWISVGSLTAEAAYNDAKRDFEDYVAGIGRYASFASDHVDVQAILATIRAGA